MKVKLLIVMFLCFCKTLVLSQTTLYYVKKNGAIGDGKHDDYLAIQKTLDQAKSTKNSTVILEEGKNYIISKPLKVNSNFNGNTSTIIPKSSQALSIYTSNVNITNLNIAGSNFQYIRLDVNGIKIKNCNFVTKSYFVLLSINGDNISIENSILRNEYKNERNFAIHSTSGISNFKSTNNKIYGGILLKNDPLKNSNNFIISDNEISVNYSNLPSSLKTQNDAVTFTSISDVQILNNNFILKDVNRGFKITDKGKYIGKSLNVSHRLPNNYIFKNNKIIANSKNGKQLFDFYIGTKNVSLVENTITASGFTTLFENKTKLNIGRRTFTLNNNIINFDSEILYFDGYGKNSDEQHTIVITNNTLNYTSNTFKFKTQRIGQNNDIKFNFIFNIRNVDVFTYQNNKFYDKNSSLNFANRYFFYIQNPLKADISSSNYKGGIKYDAIRKNSSMIYKKNINTDTKFKQSIVVDPNNKVGFSLTQ
ncbi:hypothetical protein [Sphingobacterium anhuiense]|uniref:hypothetical protein n=1 Tax=Sphingobacterium anhuiense TaxID=493780 RepID=UPI003C30A23C